MYVQLHYEVPGQRLRPEYRRTWRWRLRRWICGTQSQHIYKKLVLQKRVLCIFIYVNDLFSLSIFVPSLPPPCSSLAGGSGGHGCRPHPEGFETELRSSVGRSGRWKWEGGDFCPGVCTDSRRYAEVRDLGWNHYFLYVFFFAKHCAQGFTQYVKWCLIYAISENMWLMCVFLVQRRWVTSSASWECSHVSARTKFLKTRTRMSSSSLVGVGNRHECDHSLVFRKASFLQIKLKYLLLGLRCLMFLRCYLLLLVIWLAFPPSPLRCVSGRSWRAGSSSPGAGWRRHYAGDSSQQRRDSCRCHPGIRGLNTHAAAPCQHNHETFHLSDTLLFSTALKFYVYWYCDYVVNNQPERNIHVLLSSKWTKKCFFSFSF